MRAVEDAQHRRERIAGNEASFREVNEAMPDFPSREEGEARAHSFVCECGDRACREIVRVAYEDYAAVRAHPDRFLVAPGHVFPEAEDLVEDHEDYAVVQKHADVSATRSD